MVIDDRRLRRPLVRNEARSKPSDVMRLISAAAPRRPTAVESGWLDGPPYALGHRRGAAADAAATAPLPRSVGDSELLAEAEVVKSAQRSTICPPRSRKMFTPG